MFPVTTPLCNCICNWHWADSKPPGTEPALNTFTCTHSKSQTRRHSEWEVRTDFRGRMASCLVTMSVVPFHFFSATLQACLRPSTHSQTVAISLLFFHGNNEEEIIPHPTFTPHTIFSVTICYRNIRCLLSPSYCSISLRAIKSCSSSFQGKENSFAYKTSAFWTWLSS